MEVTYTTDNGKSGTLIITHKEGNGTNVKDEWDQGLNNFNGTYSETQPEPEPEPEPDNIEIDEPAVPLMDLPEIVEDSETFEESIEIEEEDVPLVELPDEDVPLAEVPKTGDMFGLWLALLGLGSCGVALMKKKDEA